jgi:hypothetical protein
VAAHVDPDTRAKTELILLRQARLITVSLRGDIEERLLF